MLAKGMIESEPRRARDQRLIRQISGELSITVRVVLVSVICWVENSELNPGKQKNTKKHADKSNTWQRNIRSNLNHSLTCSSSSTNDSFCAAAVHNNGCFLFVLALLCYGEILCNFAKCSLIISLRPGVSMFGKLNNVVSQKNALFC